MNPTPEQAIAYFRDMANGKSVPTAPGRKKGLGVVQTPTSYHVTTPADQALARAYEAAQRQKVIRGPENNYQPQELVRGSAKSRKRKKPNPDEYSTPGLD